MAKPKLIFNPKGDPEQEYQKWADEYFRLEGTGYKGTGPDLNRQVEEARKNMIYFHSQLPQPPKEEKPESEKTGKINQRKYKKPWPGWGKVVEKL